MYSRKSVGAFSVGLLLVVPTIACQEEAAASCRWVTVLGSPARCEAFPTGPHATKMMTVDLTFQGCLLQGIGEVGDNSCSADAPPSCKTFFEAPNQVCLPAAATWVSFEDYQVTTTRAASCIDPITLLPTLPVSSSPSCDAVSDSLYSNLGCPECAAEAQAFTALLPSCLELSTQEECEAFKHEENYNSSTATPELDQNFRRDGESGAIATSAASLQMGAELRTAGSLRICFRILCYFLLFIQPQP